MELLWKLGILSVVLVFGVKIGLAMGFAGLSKKVTAAIILGYGGGILLLTYIASDFVDQLQGFVYDYSSVLGIAMAAIILYAGFHTLKEWKINENSSVTGTCMAMIAPCPCCFGAAVAAIIIAFDTTVVGLAAGAIAYVISKVRRRWYEEYLSNLDALCESALEVMDHGKTQTPYVA